MISLKRATVQANTMPLSIQYLQLPLHQTTVSWRCKRSLVLNQVVQGARDSMDSVGGTSARDTRGATTKGFTWMKGELPLINVRLHAFTNEYWYVITSGKLTKFARYFFVRRQSIESISENDFDGLFYTSKDEYDLKQVEPLLLLTSLHLFPTWYWISTINLTKLPFFLLRTDAVDEDTLQLIWDGHPFTENLILRWLC